MTVGVPGATAVSMGAANFNGANSLGLTVSRWSSDGRVNYNAGLACGGSPNSTVVRGGISFIFK